MLIKINTLPISALLLVFGLLSNNALSSTLGQSLLVPEPQSLASSLADTTKPRLATYASNMKEAYVFSLTAGPSFAVGEYNQAMINGDGAGGLGFRLDFSGRIFKVLAIRLEYGAIAHTTAQRTSPLVKESRQILSSAFLGFGPEVRIRVGQSSQIAAYATWTSTTTVSRTTINSRSTETAEPGRGYAVGLLVRSPLDSRVSFLGNVEFRSIRVASTSYDIKALNLNLGIGINFGR